MCAGEFWKRLTVRQVLVLGGLALGSTGCGTLAGNVPGPAEIWLVPAPGEAFSAVEADFVVGVEVGGTVNPVGKTAAEPGAEPGFLATNMVLDSVTLRPITSTVAYGFAGSDFPPPGVNASHERVDSTTRGGSSKGRSPAPPSFRAASVLTTSQGGGYRPQTIRALGENPEVLASVAGQVARSDNSAIRGALVLDFQEMAPGDLPILMSVTSAIADSARSRGWASIGFALPATDTAAYPARILARAADLLVVRLHGEHRPGTPPGPLATPEWFERQLGRRVADVGATRIVAELPLFGYMWRRDGSARRISFAEARAAAATQAIQLRRHEPSGFLTAHSERDGWQIWVSDAETVERLMSSARRRGVGRFALAGVSGSDPEIWRRFQAPVTR